MADKIPEGLQASHVRMAAQLIRSGHNHRFAESTGYDVLIDGERFPPKAIIGVASSILTGVEFGPYDFKGGLKSKCFRVLENLGFSIVAKGSTDPFPDEINDSRKEGRVISVRVNRYERDAKARERAIKNHGVACHVCGFNFLKAYGAIGEGFIHVHHLVPLSEMQEEYEVDPIADLRPVCPNCHAMLHRRRPPFSLCELKEMIEQNP